MRFAIAVLVAAIAQLVVYLRFAGAIEGTPILVLPYLVLATSGAGWFAARRAAWAGALSVVAAATVYAIVRFLGPAGIGMPVLDVLGNVIAVVFTFWPYIAIGAISGALGGSLRARVLSRSHRR